MVACRTNGAHPKSRWWAWLLLDTRRHVPRPDLYDEAEAAAFGPIAAALQRAW